MVKNRLIMFDVDGTLIHHNPMSADCFKEAVGRVMGLDDIEPDWSNCLHVSDENVAHETINSRVGRGPSKEETASIKSTYIECLEKHKREGSRFVPLPGAAELFDKLKSGYKGFFPAVATGAWKCAAEFKLNSAGINIENIPIASSDDSMSRDNIMLCGVKRAASLYGLDGFSSVCYVGDSRWDLKYSRELGYRFIGVGARIEKLRELGARRVIEDYSDEEKFFSMINYYCI